MATPVTDMNVDVARDEKTNTMRVTVRGAGGMTRNQRLYMASTVDLATATILMFLCDTRWLQVCFAVLALMAFGAKAHYGYRCDREGAKP